jgi:hypothetical protein
MHTIALIFSYLDALDGAFFQKLIHIDHGMLMEFSAAWTSD